MLLVILDVDHTLSWKIIHVTESATNTVQCRNLFAVLTSKDSRRVRSQNPYVPGLTKNIGRHKRTYYCVSSGAKSDFDWL